MVLSFGTISNDAAFTPSETLRTKDNKMTQRTRTNTLTDNQIKTLNSTAKTYTVNADKLIDAVQSFKIDRYTIGADNLNRLKTLGTVCYRVHIAYKADTTKGKSKFSDIASRQILSCLNEDEINYSIRLAGFAKSDKTKLIEFSALKKWYIGEKITLSSPRRIVDTYNKHLEQVAFDALTKEEKAELVEAAKAEDKSKVYSYKEILSSFETFNKRVNSPDGNEKAKEIEALAALTAQVDNLMQEWVKTTIDAAKEDSAEK